MAETITTWEPEWVLLYVDAADSINTPKPFADWQSRTPTPSMSKEPELVKVECALPSQDDTSKLGLDETVELFTTVLGANVEDPDLSGLLAALKTKQGLSDLKKPPPTMSSGVELLTRCVKSYGSICVSAMDTCPNPFHPHVKTVLVSNVGDTSEFDMKSYGLAALAPLAITPPPPPPTSPTGATGG